MRKSKNIKLSKAKAIKYFNEYIRLRDQNKPCITCNTLKGTKDAGHFISCRFEATRFDERNVHGQCQKCNRFEYGNQYEHGKKIDEIYGEGTADSILLKSKMFCKRNQYDYEQIAEYYLNKIKEYEKKNK